jgi:hypothetical protein
MLLTLICYDRKSYYLIYFQLKCPETSLSSEIEAEVMTELKYAAKSLVELGL